MECQYQQCSKPAASGQKYCSRAHAPLGNYGVSRNENPIESEKTEKYISREHGEPSALLSIGGSAQKKNTEEKKILSHTEIEGMKRKGLSMTDIERISDRGSEENGMSIRQSEEGSSTDGERRGQEERTQRLDLAVQSPPMPEGILGSMSLIDSSAKQMHELMLAVGKQARASDFIDPRSINAAAQCAGQLRSMLKLKLEVWKELEKNGRG